MRLSSSRSTAILHRPQQDFLLWDKAGTRPSLDQQFADRKDLIDTISGQQLITFTRASAGTYVGSDGLIKTATTNEARFDHDPVTGESLGLLVEELRSNLLINSGTLATQDVTVTAVAHTLSFYGSGTVTLSGTHTATVVGTGAYPARTTLTFTPTAGTLTVTVSGTVEYANLEIGAFPTSYIPTTGSTASRSADVVSITGANFSSWIDFNDGTLFSDSEVIAPSVQTQATWSLTGGTYITSLRQPQTNGNQFRAQIGSVFTSAPGTGNLLSDGTTKACVAYSGTAGRLQVGSSSNDVTSAGVLDATDLYIGSLAGGALLNGTIRRLVYWDQRLPNDTLETITQ
jgi:hypothetical protein